MERWPQFLEEIDMSPGTVPLFAVNISKFNRSNGSPSDRILVLLSKGLVVRDKGLGCFLFYFCSLHLAFVVHMCVCVQYLWTIFDVHPLSHTSLSHLPLQLCDKKLRLKQFVDFADLKGMSVSSQNDFTVVVHVALDPSKPKTKGDVILLVEE